MALLHRIKTTKPTNLFNHFKRHYFQIHVTNHTSPITISDLYHRHHFTIAPNFQSIIQPPQHFFDSRVRFFAAPVQVVQKKEEVKGLNRPRLNDEIKAEQIRLVLEDDTHFVVSTREAMQRAKELELDLVEVDRQAKPPVCRIMDYNKERYKKKIKQKEKARAKAAGSLRSGTCKEVRFSLKAELKDLKIKADAVKRLMERGYRVKCMVLATSDQDLSGLLSKILELIEDVALVESGPHIEKRQGYFMVRHSKFGLAKKGGNKTSMLKNATDSEVEREISTCSDNNVDSEKQSYAEESSVDDENEVDAPLHVQKSTSWSVSSVSSNISHDKQKSGEAASTAPSSQAPNFASNKAPSPQGFENRYARKVPNNASTGRNPMRDPNGRGPQSPSHAYTPGGFRQAANDGPPPRSFPPRQINGPPGPRPRSFSPRQNDGPLPRDFPTRQDEDYRPQANIPNQARESGSNFTPHVGPPRPPNLPGNHVSHPSGFGIFSCAKADPSGTFESGGNANQPFSSSRSNGPRNAAVPGNMNSSASTSNRSTANDGKKRGVFSGESSNPVPRKNS